MRFHTVHELAAFLQAGGTVNGDLCSFGSMRLNLPPENWDALPEMIVHGRAGSKADWNSPDSCSVRLPHGWTFTTKREGFAELLRALDERFLAEEYAVLDVKDAVVLDIGGFIGDSAIYFAGRGARHVYVYEPFSPLASVAISNVSENGLQETVSVEIVGIGASRGRVPGRYLSGRAMSSRATSGDSVDDAPASGTLDVELITIGAAIRQARDVYPDSRLVCKVDCEGAEYEIFGPGVSSDDIRHCESLLVEFHRPSPTPIVRFLEDAGFSVTILEKQSSVGYGTILANRVAPARTPNRSRSVRPDPLGLIDDS